MYPESAMSEAARLNVQVRDWYVESFKELRNFKPIRDAESELKFTSLLRHIYHRHRCRLGLARAPEQLCTFQLLPPHALHDNILCTKVLRLRRAPMASANCKALKGPIKGPIIQDALLREL